MHTKDKLEHLATKLNHYYSFLKERFYNNLQIALPTAFVFVILLIRVSGLPYIEMMQHRAFDTLIKLKPREYVNVPVRVVDIDDKTLDELGQWPWPRTLLASMVDKLNEMGAAAIGFDSIFAEPDRISPQMCVDAWPYFPELSNFKKVAKKLPDNDKIFADSIKKKNVVTGFALTETVSKHKPLIKAGFSVIGDDGGYIRNFQGAVTNLKVLENAAAGNGSLSFISESDGVVRRVPLIYKKDGMLVPSLSAELIRVYEGAKNYAIKCSGNSAGETTGVSAIKIGGKIIPTDAWGRMWVYFTEYSGKRIVPVYKLFKKDFDKSLIKGAIVIVGTSASGLRDLRVTALNPVLPGVEVHANVVEQVLSDKYLIRPDWGDGAEVLYMVLFSMMLILIMPRLGAKLCAVFGVLAVVLVTYVTWMCFTKFQYLLDPTFPIFCVAGVYISSSLLGYIKSEREKKYVRNAFSRYMHPKLVEELSLHQEKLKLGGEMRNMTILFCDIRGFTTISEQYESSELTTVINRFLTPMTEIIMDRKGYIDKYIGDCIMAFWNAPLDDEQHIINACESALNMHESLVKLNVKWKKDAEINHTKYLPINIGIGLNTDDCCVGNLGSDQRFNYSVLGDGVNLASRLEGQSKNYGVQIVIGPKTREGAVGYAVLELDLIKVKGKTKPVNIYTLLGRSDVLNSEEFKNLEENHIRMLRYYREADFDKAELYLEKCKDSRFGLEKLYCMYAERIQTFKKNPPAKDWDGTYTATSK